MKNSLLKYLAFIGILLIYNMVKAQQDPQFSQYMYNMSVINPAYATDSPGVINIGALYRSQWVGAVGAPKTASVFLHSPVAKKIELGLSVVNDAIGDVVKENNIYVDFAYVLPLSEKSKISFGLKGGFTLFDTNFNGFMYSDPQSDPAFANNLNRVYPNIGVGTYYFSDHYYLGLSVPNLLTSKHIERNNGIQTTGVQAVHYFFTGGCVFDLNPNLKFKPAFMAKGVQGAPLSIDLTANFLLDDKVELGAGYRFDDSVIGLINIYLSSNLRVGYSYDYTLSNFGKYNSGSHELFLLFNIDLSNSAGRGYSKSPRFF